MKRFAFSFILSLFALMTVAQSISDDTRRIREEFQDRKFGIFLHWGIYSMLADGEWVMHNRHLSDVEPDIKAERLELPDGSLEQYRQELAEAKEALQKNHDTTCEVARQYRNVLEGIVTLLHPFLY